MHKPRVTPARDAARQNLRSKKPAIRRMPVAKSRFSVDGETFDAVAAVEGLELSAASRSRLAEMEAENLTASERRRRVTVHYEGLKSS